MSCGWSRCTARVAASLLIAAALATPAWTQSRDKLAAAVGHIAREIDDARKVRPTLVVWLFDTSMGEQPLRRQLAQSFGIFYKTRDGRQREGVPPIQPLWTAVVTSSGVVGFPLREPTDSYAEAWKTVDSLADEGGGPPVTFTALKQAADQYLPLRKNRGWFVIFIVVSDKAGAFSEADGPPLQQIESLAERFRDNATPLFVMGTSVPFSNQAPLTGNGGTQSGSKSAGPTASDCLHWDRIDLAYARGGSDRDLRDSGFGPWPLARLCSASGGEFLTVQTMDDNAKGFPASYFLKYAPDYLSEEKYGQLLAENKCRQALIEAAALPRVEVLQRPMQQFVRPDEAQLNNLLGQAQRAAAAVEPQIDKLYETLAAAELDRERLAGARWQAGYDLAVGRALAAKARCDGYNTMLATLKQGKTFTNVQSTTWVLKEAPTTNVTSTLENLAKKARFYLERVIKEHPDTPWAESAKRELAAPLGWTWEER